VGDHRLADPGIPGGLGAGGDAEAIGLQGGNPIQIDVVVASDHDLQVEGIE